MTLKKLKIILQTIIFLIVLTYIYFNIDLKDLRDLLNLIELGTNSFLILFTFFIITLITNIFQALRWKYLIEHFNKKSNFYLYFKFITYSNLLSEISFIGIFSRAMIKLYSEIKVFNVLITLFIEKIFSIYILSLLCFVSLFILVENNILEFNILKNEIVFLFISLMILGPLILIKYKNLKIFSFFKKKDLIKKLFYFLDFKYFGLLIITTLIIQLLAIINLCLVFQMFGLQINLLTMLLILPIINFLISIPASITPWGWREFIFLSILPLVGITNEESVLVSLTNAFLILIIQFIFYLFYLIFFKK